MKTRLQPRRLKGILMTVTISFTSSAFPFIHRPTNQRERKIKSTLFTAAGENINSNCIPETITCHIPNILTTKESEKVVDGLLLPQTDYGLRVRLGRDAQGVDASTLVRANDPCMAFTYGEFPLDSFDKLIDLALTSYWYPPSSTATDRRMTMVDIGSGCGRLCFHAALTRRGVGSNDIDEKNAAWTIHGVEIADQLHQEAARGVMKGAGYYFQDHIAETNNNRLVFHRGPADQFESLLGQCDILFAYSTVWNTIGFSEQLGAMIIAEEWSEMLSRVCRPGCIVITTDRALDPAYNWKLVDRLDVENPEVMGTTGFIQILQPKTKAHKPKERERKAKRI